MPKTKNLPKAKPNETTQKFITFLKSKRLYSAYCRNRNTDCNKPVIECLNRCLSYYMLSGAFTWSDTPEGHGFWGKIDSEWKKELKK
jgi:hypothetical protein